MNKLKYIFLALSLTLGLVFVKSSAYAHQDPANCNASGLQEFPSVSPATNVYDGDTLTYSVVYANIDIDGEGGIAPCNVTGANATITLPDGSVVNVLSNATLNVGDVVSCPGGAGCAAGPYQYAVNHADETGSSVSAQFHIDGVLHQDSNEESASDDDTLSKTVIHPTTITSISSSAAQIYAGETVDLTVTEANDGDVDLTNAHVDVDNGVGTLSAPPTSGDDGDGVLEPGETWSWTVLGVVVNSDTTFTATGHGTDPLSNDVTYPDDPEEQDSVDVDTISPSTILTKTPSETQVIAGTNVTYTYTEENDGDVDLTTPSVVDDTCAPVTYSSGDDGDGILNPGEIWTYTCSMVVNTTTTNVAVGHGTDPLGSDVTWCEIVALQEGVVCDPDERAEARVEVVNPTTITTISSSASQVLAGGTVDLTVTEQNDGDVDLTGAHVDVDNGVGTLSAPPTSGDDGDGVLEPGETWSWTVLGVVVNSDTTFTATGHGTDPLSNDVTYPSDQDEMDSVSVDAVSPTTITSISASSLLVAPGDSVTLTVTEENDGDVDLTNAHVDVDNGVGTLDSTSSNFSGDDGDGVLEPGETWQWTVDVTVNSVVTYTATGHGTDPFGNDVTYPADPEEQDAVTIEVEELGCTLTQGYWKTHSDQGPAPYDSEGWGNLGDFDGDGTEEEEGEILAYGKTWYEVFNTSPKGGNLWYQLAHQFMAAYLNMQNGASTTTEVDSALSDAEAWLASHDPADNPKANQYPDAANWASILGSYNEGTIGPGHCEE